MSTLEQQARRAWRSSGEYVFFGRCTRCGRVRDEQRDKPLLVVGRTRATVKCLECFDLGGTR